MNVDRKEGFVQVCVWPGTIVGKDSIADFEAFFKDEMNTRVQYLEEIQTAPDMRNGFPVEGTGGRNDVLFAVHGDDIMGFAIPRLKMGIRWLEDMYGNGHGALYPERVAGYNCWEEAA